LDAGRFAGTIPAYGGETTMQNQIALKISEVCAASRIGRTRVYDAIKRGELRARKHGKSTLILHDDMIEWLNALPTVAPKSTSRK
jgi:excisionase family DNA binding protein